MRLARLNISSGLGRMKYSGQAFSPAIAFFREIRSGILGIGAGSAAP
jgi:hypothetical protein